MAKIEIKNDKFQKICKEIIKKYELISVVDDVLTKDNINKIIKEYKLNNEEFPLIEVFLSSELKNNGFKWDSVKNGYIKESYKYYYNVESNIWFTK